MAYKQPRLPPLHEGERPADYLRGLILFLKDFCMETWSTVTALMRQVGALVTGVSSVNGKEGAVKLAAADVMLLGVNPLTGTANDTPSRWNALGTGYASYNTAGTLRDQPSRYGFVVSFARAGDVFQIWHSMPGGPAYVRSGNASGWNGTWRKLYDDTHMPTAAEMIDAVYPVGAVYASSQSLSPQLLFGGEWTELSQTEDGVYRWTRTQ